MSWKNLGVIALVLVVVSLAGVTAYFFAQGSFFSPDGCEWTDVDHPETREPVNNMSEYRDILSDLGGLSEEQVDRHISQYEFRNSENQGQMQFRLPNCQSSSVGA